MSTFNMSKRATDHLEPSAKKRASDRQLTQDDRSSDEGEVGFHGRVFCEEWRAVTAFEE